MIRFLFGAEFISSVQPLRIMIWVIVPYVLVTYTSLGLVALGFEKPVLSSVLTALVCFADLTHRSQLCIRFEWRGGCAVLFAEIVHAALLWYQWRMHVISKLPE